MHFILKIRRHPKGSAPFITTSLSPRLEIVSKIFNREYLQAFGSIQKVMDNISVIINEINNRIKFFSLD